MTLAVHVFLPLPVYPVADEYWSEWHFRERPAERAPQGI
jgi:hypothetical protein